MVFELALRPLSPAHRAPILRSSESPLPLDSTVLAFEPNVDAAAWVWQGEERIAVAEYSINECYCRYLSVHLEAVSHWFACLNTTATP